MVKALASDTGFSYVIGVTGAPGVGKSTTVSALVGSLRARQQRVGVLAVDPSSPFSGGALLGDRVRMQEHALDPGVYIRSMATRGQLGGLAAAVPRALRVFDAGRFDSVVVETVGVGQSEVDVAATADVTMVLLAPGMGDGIQVAKAGILEIADVLVVNKNDREGAHTLIRDLRAMVALGGGGRDGWLPPVVSVSALTGDGMDALTEALETFRHHQRSNGGEQARRTARAEREVQMTAMASLGSEFRRSTAHLLPRLAVAVSTGELDPYAAARLALDAARHGKGDDTSEP